MTLNSTTKLLTTLYAYEPSFCFSKAQLEAIKKNVCKIIGANTLEKKEQDESLEFINLLLDNFLAQKIIQTEKQTLGQLLELALPKKDLLHLTYRAAIYDITGTKNFGVIRLMLQIDEMHKHGEKIGREKGKMIKDHVCALEKKLFFFLSKNSVTPEEEASFKMDFIRELHSKDTEMSEHRKAWKPIVLNIAIALTGIGLVALIMRAIHHLHAKDSEKLEFSWSQVGFFSLTRSQGLVENTEKYSKNCDFAPSVAGK